MENYTIGIDDISFYIPKFFFKTCNLDVEQNDIGLFKKTGQLENSIALEKEDIITMANSAALNILKDYSLEEIEKIDYLIFATESSFDLSKAAGLFCKDALKLKDSCSIFEIKQACYSGTAGLIFAMNYIKVNPSKKVLIITSDISKYEKPNAQITQGAAACAFVVSSNPKIIEIEDNLHSFSKNVFDFYKPISSKYPVVDGALSVEIYCEFFCQTFKKILEPEFVNILNKEKNLQAEIAKNIILVPHLPFPNMFSFIERANKRSLNEILKNLELENDKIKKLRINFLYTDLVKKYASLIGNSYTACLYINICSLLDNCNEDLSGKEIYFFSFGSGATGTSFKGKIASNYKKFIKKEIHQKLFTQRVETSPKE